MIPKTLFVRSMAVTAVLIVASVFALMMALHGALGDWYTMPGMSGGGAP